MKRLTIIILCASGVIILLLLLMTVPGNEFVYRSNAPKTIKFLVQMIHPPKDLYKCLVKEELDVTKSGVVKTFQFKNRYLGNHNVGILLGKFSDDLYFSPASGRYNLKLKMIVNFYSQNVLIKSYTVDKIYDPFIGNKESGFSFIRYKCPEDLPLNKTILCEVKILQADYNLYNTYGPVKFYIKKLSDE